MTLEDDRRRRQYVPLATHFATARTGTRIQEEHGLEGLAVWACLLAAAKRSQIQGTFVWLSESDAWGHLGIRKPPSSFTFEEFVATLGRMKQARTRRIGGESHTTLTRFSEWNKAIRLESDAARKRRKRAQKAADTTADDPATLGVTEGEGEGETPTPFTRDKRSKPQPGHPCPICGARQDTRSMLEDHLQWTHHADPATHLKAATA